MTASSRNPLKLRWKSLTQGLTSPTSIYVIKRLLQAALTLLLASALCFLICELAPGDFFDNLRENPKYTQQYIDQLRQQYGLDCTWANQLGARSHLPEWLSIFICWCGQYWHWLTQVLTRGDFGPSLAYRRSVISLLVERVPATLLLAISSLVVTWAIAIPLGIIGAVQQNRWSDRILQVLSYAGQGFPSFITGLILLIFAQNTSPLFPVGDMTSIDYADFNILGKTLDIGWHLILPTIALSLTSFAGLQRITRGELLDVLRQDYIQTARAKGLPENRVIYIHALRNAINPLITLLGFEFSTLLGGAFVTEYFFNWPGLGRLILQAVQSQDIFLVMASLMMGAVMLILGNLLADLLLKSIDPRIKLEDLN